LIYETQTAT